MTATIFYRVKGMFSGVDVEETVYGIETARDGKGIRKIINAMKEPYRVSCRFDSCKSVGESFYVERGEDDIENGTYRVRCSDSYRNYTDRVMDAKNLIKLLEDTALKKYENLGDY